MLNIFKNYSSKTSILDDFQFYENRQRAMQEKRTRQQAQQHRDRHQVGILFLVISQSVSEFSRWHSLFLGVPVHLTFSARIWLQLSGGDTEQGVLDDSTGKFNKMEKVPDVVAQENGCVKPRILSKPEVRHPTASGDSTDLATQRLGQLRLSEARDESALAEKKNGDAKPATCEREAALMINTSLSNDKNGLVKQEQ